MRNPFRSRWFVLGFFIQATSALLLGLIHLAIRLEWTNIVEMAFESGIDKVGPRYILLKCSVVALLSAFLAGSLLCGNAAYKLWKAQKG